MSLFFDADWFDARLAERGLDRNALAGAAGLSREELHRIIVNEREATAAELSAFAALLGADVVEINLRSGISVRSGAGDSEGRLDDLDARLDRIDRWLDQVSKSDKPEAEPGSPMLRRVVGGG